MSDILNLEPKSAPVGPVECLGMTFANDEERRKHFLGILREKLKDPEFRKIEGFPLGADEDILALSDPPYYTACPNPFVRDFIAHWSNEKRGLRTEENPDNLTPENTQSAALSTQPYHREPFAVDVSVGKTDQIYRAHSYHTKVPHLAIVPSILHYTEPGDVVLDGFCGSGMTGVAAQWCGVAPNTYRMALEGAWKKEGRIAPKWGARRAVLNDLSPAATFIGANYNIPFDVNAFAKAGKQLLKDVEQDIGWMYETLHSDGKAIGRIEYTVWSEVFSCPECAGEVNFLDEALDEESKRVKDEFPCPHCNAGLTKKKLERLYITKLDRATGNTLQVPKRMPSLISYRIRKTRYEKKPDANDLEILERIDQQPFPTSIPTTRMMHASPEQDSWGDKWRVGTASFTHVHHLYLPRAAQAMGLLWTKAQAHPDPRIRGFLLFMVEQAIWGLSVLNRYGPTHFSQVNRMLTGVYYVASQHSECSPWYNLGGKLDRLVKAFTQFKVSAGGTAISTGTAARLLLPGDSVDYIFTDPPFGENLAYSELNFLVEAFHGVFTEQKPEAIVSKVQAKDLMGYHGLMLQCFKEYHRVLKPGRWMTVVFSNTSAAVWNGIQSSMQQAGFVVANVSVLNKQQGSFNAVTNTTSVKQDLVISAYKPNGGFEQRFQKEAQTEEGVWDFVRTHMKYLPVVKRGTDISQLTPVTERDPRILYDQMIAYYVRKGFPVPLNSADFQEGLSQRFSYRDGMYFLPDQVAEYDKRRLASDGLKQATLFVSDESSAIAWLRQLLKDKPQTFQDIHPLFIKELGGWQKYEKPLELSELLEQNFLCYDGAGLVPEQIHAYLSTNWKDLRNLPKDAPSLRAKAKNRWYVPDPNKAGDLEKLRERSLLKEFEDYRTSAQRRLKVFRLEAVRAGFKKAWQERDYDTIIAVAQKIPENILQEDPKLLMWYDQAMMRKGGE